MRALYPLDSSDNIPVIEEGDYPEQVKRVSLGRRWKYVYIPANIKASKDYILYENSFWDSTNDETEIITYRS